MKCKMKFFLLMIFCLISSPIASCNRFVRSDSDEVGSNCHSSSGSDSDESQCNQPQPDVNSLLLQLLLNLLRTTAAPATTTTTTPATTTGPNTQPPQTTEARGDNG